MTAQDFIKLDMVAHDARSAAQAVRILCGVASRSELTNDNYAWRDLVERYRAWEMALV